MTQFQYKAVKPQKVHTGNVKPAVFNGDDPTKIAINIDPTIRRITGVTNQGHIPFDVPFITEIADNLYQGGCASGLVLPEFIKHLVSVYPWEEYAVDHEIESLVVVRMFDSADQSFEKVESLAAWVNAARKTGSVLVHCQAGLNRSSLIVARALMLDGMSADEAIAHLRKVRSPACLCNPSFENYLRNVR